MFLWNGSCTCTHVFHVQKPEIFFARAILVSSARGNPLVQLLFFPTSFPLLHLCGCTIMLDLVGLSPGLSWAVFVSTVLSLHPIWSLTHYPAGYVSLGSTPILYRPWYCISCWFTPFPAGSLGLPLVCHWVIPVLVNVCLTLWSDPISAKQTKTECTDFQVCRRCAAWLFYLCSVRRTVATFMLSWYYAVEHLTLANLLKLPSPAFRTCGVCLPKVIVSG